MKTLQFTALGMATLLYMGACKKENKSNPLDPGVSGQPTQAVKRRVQQATLSSDPNEIAKLVAQFKKSAKEGSNNARLINEESSDLAYATSVLEATLNFDHDESFSDNFETQAEKIVLDIPVTTDNKVNSDQVEAIYEQLDTWVTQRVSADKKLMLIDIESYVLDASTGLANIEGYAVFMLVNKVGMCNIPVSWSKYPVSAGNRNTPSPGCNGFQEFSPTYANYSPGAVPDINWMVNCTAVNTMECNGNGYYWFPLVPYDVVGNPDPLLQPAALYTSGYNSYNWSCYSNNLNYYDMAGFKSAIMAEATNHFPAPLPSPSPAWMVAIKIITETTNTYQPHGSNPIKAMYWDNLHIEYGIKKCHGPVIG